MHHDRWRWTNKDIWDRVAPRRLGSTARSSNIDCLYDPDVVRASEPQHTVKGRGGDGNLGGLGCVSSRPQRVPNHTFAPANRRRDFRANIIIAGFLPCHPAMLSD